MHRPGSARGLDTDVKPAILLFLDSASITDAQEAAGMGYVTGITTNPTLMASKGRSALEKVRALLDVFPGTVFHQPVTSDPAEARAEIDDLVGGISGQRVVAKLPALPALFPLAASLHASGIPCAVTAVYSSGQAALAAAAHAGWIIPYVNRAKRLKDDGATLVPELARFLDGRADRPLILAASLKSADEAIQALEDGADGVSVPMNVLRQLGEHSLTRSAVEQFERDAGHG